MKKITLIVILFTGVLSAQTAQEVINTNGCLACHAVASKKAAPAFAGIGMRNKRFEGDNAKATIINSIKNGSQGKYPKFSDAAMPAYPNLSIAELNSVAEYILSQSSKAKGHGGGMGKGNGMGKGMR